MPSLFEISVAAFAIGMATNAGMPNHQPQPMNTPPQARVIVHDEATPVVPAKTASAVPVPTPKPDHTPEDSRDCFTARGVVTMVCPPAPVTTAAQ